MRAYSAPGVNPVNDNPGLMEEKPALPPGLLAAAHLTLRLILSFSEEALLCLPLIEHAHTE